MKDTIEHKKALLKLHGAHCTSCAITIEHAGKKIDGINDIFVDRGTSTIHVDYNGENQTLSSVINIVQRIGYNAEIQAVE
jgi:copper chaperone CopZ